MHSGIGGGGGATLELLVRARGPTITSKNNHCFNVHTESREDPHCCILNLPAIIIIHY